MSIRQHDFTIERRFRQTPAQAFRAFADAELKRERIVFAYDLLLDGRLISVSLTTVEVRPDGDGTRLVFTEHGAFFDDLEDPAEREHGTGLLLDGLAAFLGEQVAA